MTSYAFYKRARAKRPTAWQLGAVCATLVFLGIGISMVIMQRAPDPSPPPRARVSFKGARLFVDPNSNAIRQADSWRVSRPDQAQTLDTLAALPTAKWLTTEDALSEVPAYLAAARTARAVPVLVIYNIPGRDCGRYSAGGATSDAAYKTFIDDIAKKIGTTQVAVILEPDALAGIQGLKDNGKPCLTNKAKAEYFTLLNYAVSALKNLPATHVYIDAGNSAWDPDAKTMAARLKRAGVQKADGFSLNISNFQTTENTIAFGNDIAKRLDNTHFVIDTSRNGRGPYTNPIYPDYNWCNPPGRALGNAPTTTTGHDLVDAYLYIKYPGESDGTDPDTAKCFGGPAAGVWWPEYAAGLIERWPAKLQR